jgi:hypothetical protein
MTTEWDDLCESLRASGAELLAAAPDDDTRIEGLAYLARVAAYRIEQYLLSLARQTNGILFGVGGTAGSNPEFRYGTAPIDSSATYRIKGQMNQAYRVALGLYTLLPDGGFQLDDYRGFSEGDAALPADGTFDIEITPAGTPGEGLKSKPTTNIFLTREIVLDRDGVRADIALEPDPPLDKHTQFSATALLRDFEKIKDSFTGPVAQYLKWTNWIAAKPNVIEPLRKEFDDEIQGDPTIRYWTGYFHLAPEQSLLVEVPEMECEYWGLMLTNHWQEPLAQSSLNQRTAEPDADGVTRIVIAHQDPGCKNWLSTEGRSRGVIWHRRVSADNMVDPRCTLRG